MRRETKPSLHFCKKTSWYRCERNDNKSILIVFKTLLDFIVNKFRIKGVVESDRKFNILSADRIPVDEGYDAVNGIKLHPLEDGSVDTFVLNDDVHDFEF